MPARDAGTVAARASAAVRSTWWRLTSFIAASAAFQAARWREIVTKIGSTAPAAGVRLAKAENRPRRVGVLVMRQSVRPKAVEGKLFIKENQAGFPAADDGRGTTGDQATLIYRAVCLKERRLCRNDRTRLRGTGGSGSGHNLPPAPQRTSPWSVANGKVTQDSPASDLVVEIGWINCR
jgi:hypothetical protein